MASKGLVVVLAALCICLEISASVGGKSMYKDGPGDNVVSRLKYDLFVKGKYDKFTRPVRNIKISTPVEVALSVYYFSDLDSQTQTLTLQCFMKMNWTDEFLQWNPHDYEGMKLIRAPSSDVWKPDITLYNNAEARDFLAYGESRLILYSEGTVLWVPPVTHKSICKMNMKNYPFDVQICNLTFGSWVYDRGNIDLRISRGKGLVNFVDNNVENPEWSVKKWEQYYEDKEYPCCPGTTYPSVTIELHLQRRTSFHYYTVIMPSTLSAVLTLVIFWLSPASGQRIALGGFNLVVLSVLLTHVTDEIGASVQIPYAVMFIGATMLMTCLAIVFTIVSKNLVCLASVTRPPRFLMDVLLSPVRYVLFLFPASPSMSDRKDHVNLPMSLHATGTKSFDVMEMTSETEWTMVAMVIDRILFLAYVIVLASICASA